MKNMRWVAMLLCLCMLITPLCGWAAPGEAVMFNSDISPNEAEYEMGRMYAYEGVMLDGMFYVWDGAVAWRWKPEMAKPEKFCELPPYPAESWDTYEKAKPEIKKELDNMVTLVAAGEGKLWAFNVYAGRLGNLTEKGVEWLDVKLDMKDMVFEEGEEKRRRERYVAGAMMFDGGFYCLRDNYNNEEYNDARVLMRWDVATGEQKQYPLQQAQMAVPYKPGQLLTYGRNYDNETGEPTIAMTVLDLATGQETPLNIKLPDDQQDYSPLGGLVYDEASDSIYFTQAKRVWRSEKGGPAETVAYLTQANVSDRGNAWLLPGGLYAVIGGGLFIRNLDPQYLPKRELRVSGVWEDMTYLAFSGAHPDVPVLFQNSYGNSGESIAQALTGGDKETDIFVLNAESGLRPLIEKGFAADLSASEVLSKDVERMYPQVQAVLRNADGKPMAYPRSFGVGSWSVNKQLWEKFDMGPMPTTYSQLFDYMLRWNEEFAEDNPDATFMNATYDGRGLMEAVLHEYVLQYEQAGQPIDFTAPVLREVLDKIAALELETPKFEEMSESEWEEYNQLTQKTAIFVMYGMQGMFHNPDETQYVNTNPEYNNPYQSYARILPMVFEEGQEPKVRATMEVYVVNPASANQDLALQYLEFVAQSKYENQVRYALHPDMSEPVERENFERTVKDMKEWRETVVKRLETLEGSTKRDYEDELNYVDRWLAEQDKNRWEISAQGIAGYRELAPHMTFTAGSVFFTEASTETSPRQMMNELLQRYTDGQMPMDAFLRELNSKMRMVILEGQ